MTVTVRDCLKLPSLSEASVAAGEDGLDRIVLSISVLEYAEPSVLQSDFFSGNQLLISALISIKDDVEAQCATIHRLHELGEAGLLLYYVGKFLPKLDEQLLEIANELKFPLICMPTDRHYRYNEVISEVMEIILCDRGDKIYFISDMLKEIAKLPSAQRTMDTVLRILSEQLNCILLLINNRLQYYEYETWCTTIKWDYENILAYMNKKDIVEREQPFEMIISNKKVWISYTSVSIKNNLGLKLVAIDETGTLQPYFLEQAARVIQLFINIWKYDLYSRSVDDIVKAILNEHLGKIESISKAFHLDVSALNNMWILKSIDTNQTYKKRISFNAKLKYLTKTFLQEHRKNSIVDIFNDDVVAFIEDPKFYEQQSSLPISFIDSFKKSDINFILFICTRINTSAKARDFYELAKSCFKETQLIFPDKKVISMQELQFVKDCISIMGQGEKSIEKSLRPLEPLQAYRDSKELIETLSIYLLDTYANVQKTGDRMFLHENTIRYRINKIEKELGYNITEMPEYYYLYFAVGLKRLLRK